MPDIDFAFQLPSRVSIPIAGESRHFPVRRIYCVGRNYADHIREMGGDERQPPFFFQKPTDAIVLDGAMVPYPTCTKDFQHEIELVLAISSGGIDIPTDRAESHVFGVAVGIDLTRRDVQIQARNAGRPWEVGKAFDRSAPLGRIHVFGANGIPSTGEISLSVNGQLRQRGNLTEMIWRPTEIVSQLSRQYRLEPGDLIYTGTPAGVGPLSVGDVVEGRIAGLTPVRVSIVAPVQV
jgi:fumarylpyruvate hydrolase